MAIKIAKDQKTPKSAGAPGAAGATNGTSKDLEKIRQLAYLKWEAAGKPEGSDRFFWLEAERELLQRK